MSNFRIVKKQMRGYEPTYHFQEKHFYLLWVTIVWGLDRKYIVEYKNKYYQQCLADNDLGVIWQD